jgi:DNA modification methylase
MPVSAPKKTRRACKGKEPPPGLRLEWMDPADLNDNPLNWRRHPEKQTGALAAALEQVGWAGALLYNEQTKHLIDGHARKKVSLSKTGRVPVLIGSWTEEQEKLILATLDPLAAMAEADTVALDKLLREVGTGNDPQLDAMLAELGAENPVVEPLPEPGAGGDDFDSTAETGPTRTNVGELWVIGGVHRLLVGDCTVAENVARLMGGEKAGLCFTSPPYAQQRDYGQKITDWNALMFGAFGCLPMADDGQVLVNLGLIHRDGEWVPYWEEWIAWMREQGWRRFGWYVWDQSHGLPGNWNGRFAPSHEFVFHFNKQERQPEKTVECKTVGEWHGSAGMRGADGEVRPWSSPGVGVQSHKIPDSVIRVCRQMGGVEGHAAPFPIGLPALAVASWPGDVYDPFLGSGTTMVAAHRLGRRAYGCELEPRYCDVILRRAEAEGLTVEKAS